VLENNFYDFSEIELQVSIIKETCGDTECVRNLMRFLEEQIEVLEDNCYERERGDGIFNEDE